MLPALRQWKRKMWQNQARVLLTASAIALVFAMVACNNKKKEEGSLEEKGLVPVAVTASNFQSFQSMASAHSVEAQQLIDSTANKAAIKTEAKAVIKINSLNGNGQLSTDATLRLIITVSSGDKTATAQVDSSAAALAVVIPTGAEPEIRGYWTLNGAGGYYSAYVGINAYVKRASDDTYNLVGNLVSNFDNNGTIETMAELNSNVCEYVTDAGFISHFYSDSRAPDCRNYKAN